MNELPATLRQLLDLLLETRGVSVRWLKQGVLLAQVPRPDTDVQARFIVIELASSPTAVKDTMTLEEIRQLNHALTGSVRPH